MQFLKFTFHDKIKKLNNLDILAIFKSEKKLSSSSIGEFKYLMELAYNWLKSECCMHSRQN